MDGLEHFSVVEEDGSLNERPDVVQLAVEHGVYVCKTICAGTVGYLDAGHIMPEGMMQSLLDRGVRIVAGTDAGIDNTPHKEYVFGLEGMAAYGMSNEEVLVAATRVAAESLGLDEVTGTLQKGKEADVLAVRGNPLEDLGLLRDVITVVAGGQEYVPEFRSELNWNTCIATPAYVPDAPLMA